MTGGRSDNSPEGRPGGRLLASVITLLSLGCLLLLLAKGPALTASGAIDVNRATPSQIQRALNLPEELTSRLLFHRGHRREFADIDALRQVPLLSPEEAQRAAALRTSTSSEPLTAAKLASSANLPPAVAQRILDAGASWSAPPKEAALRSLPIIPRAIWSAARSGLIVRSGRAFVRGFLFTLALLFLAFALTHRLLLASGARRARLLAPLVLLLTGFSVITLVSIKDPLRDGLAYQHHAWGVLAGLGLMLVASRLRYAGLAKLTYLSAAAAVLLALLLLLRGVGPGRLSLWGTQPMEAIKILLVIFAAGYLARHGSLLEHRVRARGGLLVPDLHDLGPLLVAYGIALLALFVIRDLGPVLILFGALLVMLYVSTGRLLYPAAGLLLLISLGAIGYLVGMHVVQTRVDMWLSPWHNSRTGGEQLAQAYWGIASGGIAGSGLGLGSPADMPRAGSDLILASVSEEWGLLGVVLVISALLLVLQRGLRLCAACQEERRFEFLLGLGLISLLALSGLLIAGGTVGLIPLTGVTLPFVCYGNSALLAAFFSLGVLLSLDRDGGEPVQPRRVRTRLRWLVIAGAAAGALVVARAGWIATAQADLAARSAWSPDADGVTRPHVNPRLLALAEGLPTGRLLDRAGRALAEGGRGQRRYPYGSLLVHLIGYTDPRYGGPVGIEKTAGGELRGFESYADLLPVLRTKDLPWHAAGPAPRDVRLTVDAALQREMVSILRRATRRLTDQRAGEPKRKAAAVLLDVRTGDLLAAASLPSFDPNALSPELWRDLTSAPPEDSRLLDRSRFGLYPPGSTFKVVTAAAALESRRSPILTCRHRTDGLLWYVDGQQHGPRALGDIEEARPHGRVDLQKALVRSCNVYFSQLGIALGAGRLHETAARFGFSRLPSAGALGEALPDAALGQGPVLATPLEMARVAAVVANDGVLVEPHLLASTTPAESRVMSERTARELRRAMRDVVAAGTAQAAFQGFPLSVAGKTGSAENNQADAQPHSWFIGFAPAGRPRVAFAVLVENGGLGARVAAPAAREILDAWWRRREAR